MNSGIEEGKRKGGGRWAPFCVHVEKSIKPPNRKSKIAISLALSSPYLFYFLFTSVIIGFMRCYSEML
jgi:hypothetical protein